MQQPSTKRIQKYAGLGGKGNLLRISQEMKIWPYKKMVYMHKPESVLENKMYKIFRDFEIHSTQSSLKDQTRC